MSFMFVLNFWLIRRNLSNLSIYDKFIKNCSRSVPTIKFRKSDYYKLQGYHFTWKPGKTLNCTI